MINEGKIYVFREHGKEVCEDKFRSGRISFLFLPHGYFDEAAKYLENNGLSDKFQIIKAEVEVGLEDDVSDQPSIYTLAIEFLSDEALFEYSLSGKSNALIELIREHCYYVMVERYEDGKEE